MNCCDKLILLLQKEIQATERDKKWQRNKSLQKEVTDIDLNANIPSDGLFDALSKGLFLLGNNKEQEND